MMRSCMSCGGAWWEGVTWCDATRSVSTMKRRGSVWGRAGTGTGLGPGVEQVITLSSNHLFLQELAKGSQVATMPDVMSHNPHTSLTLPWGSLMLYATSGHTQPSPVHGYPFPLYVWLAFTWITSPALWDLYLAVPVTQMSETLSSIPQPNWFVGVYQICRE